MYGFILYDILRGEIFITPTTIRSFVPTESRTDFSTPVLMSEPRSVGEGKLDIERMQSLPVRKLVLWRCSSLVSVEEVTHQSKFKEHVTNMHINIYLCIIIQINHVILLNTTNSVRLEKLVRGDEDDVERISYDVSDQMHWVCKYCKANVLQQINGQWKCSEYARWNNMQL